MKQEILNKLIASAELRNPGIFNASRERYIAEISFKKAIDLRDKEWVDWIKRFETTEVLDPDDDNKNYRAYLVPVKSLKSKMVVKDENT